MCAFAIKVTAFACHRAFPKQFTFTGKLSLFSCVFTLEID